jgi:Na+/melibiose symporter-like transporter
MAATGVEERDHAFSFQTAAMPLGAVVGSLLGGFLPGLVSRALAIPLDRPAPYRYPLVLVGVVYVIGLFATIATREVSTEQGQQATSRSGASRAGYLPLALIGLMGLVMALRVTGERAANTFFNVYMDAGLGVSTSLIGTLAAGTQLVAGAAVLAMPLLAERWGKERVIGIGSVAVAFALLPLALIPHWAAAGAGYLGASVLAGIVTAAIFVYGQGLVPPSWHAVMSGAIWMGVGIGGAAIVIGGGRIIATSGYAALFLIAAGITAVGGLLFWSYFRVPRGELARAPKNSPP